MTVYAAAVRKPISDGLNSTNVIVCEKVYLEELIKVLNRLVIVNKSIDERMKTNGIRIRKRKDLSP